MDCSIWMVITSKILFHFRYTVSVRVEEKQPYRQRTYTWCWSIPFRCSKYKIRIKTIYRTEVSKNISATIPNFSSLKYAAFNFIWCWNVYSKVISTPYYCLFVISSKLKTYLFIEKMIADQYSIAKGTRIFACLPCCHHPWAHIHNPLISVTQVAKNCHQLILKEQEIVSFFWFAKEQKGVLEELLCLHTFVGRR